MLKYTNIGQKWLLLFKNSMGISKVITEVNPPLEKMRWNYMAIFCTIYYVLSYIETIPQIVKLLKTKSSNDYSLGMISLQLIALISWSLYIFTSKQSIVVYIGTIIDLVLLLFVDFLIIKYYKFNKKGVGPNERK